MKSAKNDWGPWTEEKLKALGEYMKGFTTASYLKAPRIVYLDLFAGIPENESRTDEDRKFPGSTVRALEVEPKFTDLRFIEKDDEKARQLTSDLREKFPDDTRYKVTAGDCNKKITEVLAELTENGLSKSPTLAFIDPCTFHVEWDTFKAIANFKTKKYKAEMLVLFSIPGIHRFGGLVSSNGHEAFQKNITNFFGSDIWATIEARASRNSKEEGLSPSKERSLYIILFRYLLEKYLGYKITIAVPVDWIKGPQYVLIFATDHKVGQKIMTSVFDNFVSDLDNRKKIEEEYLRRKKKEAKGQYSFLEDDKFFLVKNSKSAKMDRYYSIDSLVGKATLPRWLLQELKSKEY